ncbi:MULTISPECIES: hypothetical protein [Caloramator]|uniref:hypothetical protein n=1 Tax=Caloramator TaxID=44258 RepID=UPI000426442E|nr:MULTISPECIES: hypothetical protein [Caloramator]
MVGRGSKVVSLKVWRLKKKCRGLFCFIEFIKGIFKRQVKRQNKKIDYKKPVNN